jgi:predicted nucleotidyltransferase component of viral defense system
MIPKYEIMEHAKEYGLSANTIEKDYVLSWLLFGIANSNELKQKWIFKGGTCLKKCYFEQYRFSEDLDFTITDPKHINKDFFKTIFSDISS